MCALTMRADSSEAVTFYSERIRDGFRDAGESINSVGKQLAGWLRRDGGEDEDEVEVEPDAQQQGDSD